MHTRTHARLHSPSTRRSNRSYREASYIPKRSQLLPQGRQRSTREMQFINWSLTTQDGQTFWPAWQICYADSVSASVISQAIDVRNAARDRRCHPAYSQRLHANTPDKNAWPGDRAGRPFFANKKYTYGPTKASIKCHSGYAAL